MRPITSASRCRNDRLKFWYTLSDSSDGDAPQSTSSDATEKDSGSAFWYWKRPVSVAMAQYRQRATSLVISTPRYSANSATSTPAAAALGRTRLASAYGSSHGWWSMIAVRAARLMTGSASFSLWATERSTLMNMSGSPS